MQPEAKSRELDILSYIDQHENATQRQLSEHIGLSLGTINMLLKRLIKKGLVKIERLQPNSVKYFLTPAGIASKLERTYGYITRTYREIEQLKQNIVNVSQRIAEKYNVDTLYFFGPKDDFAALLFGLSRIENLRIDIKIEHAIENLKKQQIQKAPILVWSNDSGKQLNDSELDWLNIMGLLGV